MKIFVILLALCTVLCSCSSEAHSPYDGDGASAERPQAADYTHGDISYTLTVSDGDRSVSLAAVRKDGVTVASVTAPDELAGAVLRETDDGVVVAPAGDCEEVLLSREAASGLAALLRLTSWELTDAVASADGGLKLLRDGWEACVHLDSDGYPTSAELTGNGGTRCVEIAVDREFSGRTER